MTLLALPGHLTCRRGRCTRPAAWIVTARGPLGYSSKPSCDLHADAVTIAAEKATGGRAQAEPLPDAPTASIAPSVQEMFPVGPVEDKPTSAPAARHPTHPAHHSALMM